MPTYQFRDVNTGEIHDVTMTIAEREEFVKAHPHLVQQFTALNLGDPVRLGVTKPPADFMKGVIGRMQESIPGNKLKSSGKFQVPKEI